ncbi:MAG: hypothetical protein V1701_02990 [Planctomycetota bacterium]
MPLGTMQNYAKAVTDGAIRLMYTKYGVGGTTWEKATREVIDNNIAILTYVSRLSGKEWNKFQNIIEKEINEFQEERQKMASNPGRSGAGDAPIRKEIRTKEDARQAAIDWQRWASEQSLSYGELAEHAAFFEALAKRFGLTKEFRENGII